MGAATSIGKLAREVFNGSDGSSSVSEADSE